ncbi:MAG: hypothetical protein JST39_11065 [Bacteroidetes bacterium]|nr:hypothetical protein [Bacteroidota bacterium]
MNKRTSYEKIIAAKAERQVVPDMADAVWAAVSAELDQLPPVSDEGKEVVKAPGSGGASILRILGYGILAAAAAAALIFWWSQQKKPLPPPKKQPLPVTAPASPPDENKHVDTARLQPHAPPVPIIPQPDKNEPPIIDSAAHVEPTLENNTTTKGIRIITPHAPSAVIKDSLAKGNPLRRPRGVPGIGSDDYKIVPAGRDSTNKNLPGRN